MAVFTCGKVSSPFSFNASFYDSTWEDIILACQMNNVPESWNVGDYKPMTINGVEYRIDIIGKRHDPYSDGTGIAPLTFQLHDCYETTYPMNNSNTNTTGWTSCQMRTTTLPNILALMPDAVQNGVREVNKLTSVGGDSYTISTTADKLFLLSEKEVFDNHDLSFAGEGTQYAYYANWGSKIKTVDNSEAMWGLRSPYDSDGSTASFVIVMAGGGDTRHLSANENRAVSFAFCF